MTPQERQREARIQTNKKLLESLGLDKPFFEPKAKRKAVTQAQPRKRKTPPSDESEDETPAKVSKSDEDQTRSSNKTEGPRRSGRIAGMSTDTAVNGGGQRGSRPHKARGVVSIVETKMRSVDKRVHDPKRFGHIPGVPVGTCWETREACSKDAIHAPWVAGISGSAKGAYSVCLSGGYEDDVDLGYGFTYTGSGGRDLKGTKNAPKNLRTAPQSSDQSFENSFNMALKVSSETGRPIRVIRGFKLKSEYAPFEGYRYDGLYTVEKAWMEPGLNKQGYLVCKFVFKRQDGQPPLPVRVDDDENSSSEHEDEDEMESGSQEEDSVDGKENSD